MELKSRLKFAMEMAEEASKTILNYYQDPKLKVDLKKDRSVVTEADRNAELKIRELLKSEYPEDGVLGEEFGSLEGKSDYKWILDPIDGTQSFVCGVPLFGTLIGLTFKSHPVLGVANFPALNEIYFGASGEGAWWRPHHLRESLRAQVSEVSSLKEALMCATSIKDFDQPYKQEVFDRLKDQSGRFRGWSDCYGHVLVATGRAEIMYDSIMHPWDCAALIPIVTEAGGKFFDLSGTTRIDGGNAISTNGALAAQVRSLLPGRVTASNV